jgi:hypothetical protein
MIYILTGNDTKKKNIYIKKLCKDKQPSFLSALNINKEIINDYALSVSLFGESPIIVAENIFDKEDGFTFNAEELLALKDSETTFIFKEDKLLATDIKKYSKYAEIEDFNNLTYKKAEKINIFNIAEAFSKKDKINTWILYREAISTGSVPEEISGIIFWKIKTMLLSGTKVFSKDELKIKSSELVSLYHKAHMGECDFTIGLEQFILSSLNNQKR